MRGRDIALCLAFSSALGLTVLPATSSDSDGDGYVGRFDSVAFVGCLGGPGLQPQPGCIDLFDDDDDGDVDAADFAAFVECLSGPVAQPSPPEPECAHACVAAFDADLDGDLDLADFQAFQTAFGP